MRYMARPARLVLNSTEETETCLAFQVANVTHWNEISHLIDPHWFIPIAFEPFSDTIKTINFKAE